MIIGTHAILYTKDAEVDRAFLRDVLGWSNIDAGDGWLIFKLPPAELGIHPDEQGGKHELYLLCDDIEATMADLEAKGVEVVRPATDQGWGLLTAIRLPGGGELGLYEARHPTAF
jgi:predicted enzyme related to lactoylglutathione lyase